jgi:hypothetical protein
MPGLRALWGKCGKRKEESVLSANGYAAPVEPPVPLPVALPVPPRLSR